MDKNSPSIYDNNLFSNHFLEERIQDTEKWQQTDVEEKFDELRKLYDSKSDLLSEKLNEDQTQSEFINPVLKALGHKWVPEARTRVGSKKKGTILNPDYTFMDMETQMDVHEDEEKSYFDVNYAVGDAKAWNRKLDKSTQDHSNPAFQIYNYVDRLRASWGILTNGKKWRLYSYEKCAADIYFEIDLENLLAGEKTEEKLEQFKYFYLLFEREAFEQGFLQKIYQESVNFAEGLEDDLEDKVYNALEVAVEGFFETNNLDKTEENIDLVHHASLIFLYRVLFILNAESRDLLPTDYEAYKQAFGLTQLKRMIVENEAEDPLFQETTVAWDNRISRLFEGIDGGYDLNETEIPAYNGGLFDEEESEENQFLARNKLYGSYIKEILELLATSYDEEKEKRIILDYKDLNIRHLGSVYEGLLEHKFKVADERKILKNGEWTDLSETNKDWEEFEEEKRAEENELYLTNESGERKATGSYYTPEYIVEYIVENTVGPKVEEKISEARENDSNVLTKILELNVCDPAMGSGHFLTEATEYIAEHIVQHANLEKQNLDENEDELNWAKRQVVQNCIYGVDVNELAVELGKLSLWIETAARGKPLNFLDHHLKRGNSLIGSDFDQIFSHPTEDQKRLDSERYQFGDPQEIKESSQEQYREIEEMPENTVEQIHEKEQAYKQFISNNTLYQQFNQLANLHTRQYFQKEANSSDYESFLINIGNPGNPFENTEWYKNSQQDAENRNYFHWQLEFPKVFFGEQNGFDAVVGNPPYIRVELIPDSQADYYKEIYETTMESSDIYTAFYERSDNLSERVGLIFPNQFFNANYGEKLREHISEKANIEKLVDFNNYSPFEGISTYTCIMISGNTSEEFEVMELTSEEDIELAEDNGLKKELFRSYRLSNAGLGSGEWTIQNPKKKSSLQKIESADKKLGGSSVISSSLKTGRDSLLYFEIKEENEDHFKVERDGEVIQLEKGMWRKVIRPKQAERWRSDKPKKIVFFPYNVEGDEFELINESKFESEYPKTYSLLEEFKDQLLQRKDSRKTWEEHGYPWYSLHRLGKPVNYEPDKIISQTTVKETKFALDEKSYLFPCGGVVGITPDEYDKYSLLAQLNSAAINFWIFMKGSAKRGGYYSVNVGTTESMPVKEDERLIEKGKSAYKAKDKFVEEKQSFLEWVEAEWGVDVDDLSLKTHLREYCEYDFDEFIRVAKKNKSQIDGSVKSREFRELMKEEWENSMNTLRPLMQEIDELENEIDAIVFDLYDLTEEEVETVLDSLDTKEGERGRILESFIELN